MIAAKLRLGPDDHVIEIGTGWGGFAIHAAEQHGCRVTTTTISEAQRSLAEKRVAEHGLTDRVTVLGADYRDLEGRYDALVSIEMIEAVDWRRHDQFFATCARLLTAEGRMALQAITIEDASYERAKLHDDFIRAMVFPGGCLPSVSTIAASVARTSNLRIVDLQDIGPHYAETLRRWRANLEDQRPAVERLGFDERFWRFWTLYLCYCEAAFMERHVSDVQAGPGPARSAQPASRAAHLTRREPGAALSGRRDAGPRSPRPGCVHRRRSTPHRGGLRASSPAMPAPPTSTGRPGLTSWTARTIARTARSWFPAVTPTATASAVGVLVTALPNASSGTFAPRSTTSKPWPRRTLAAMAVGKPCNSCGGVPRITLPRLGPRVVKRAPSRATTRDATPEARCSSSTV